MALRTAALCAFVAFAFLVAADAQCIECNACGQNNGCLSTCQRECPKPPVGINVENCKKSVEATGQEAAKTACELTLKYCSPGASPKSARAAPPASNRVTLAQCGNAAFGTCQAVANNANRSPCGKQFNGVGLCTTTEFKNFYTRVADDECNRRVAVFDKP